MVVGLVVMGLVVMVEVGLEEVGLVVVVEVGGKKSRHHGMRFQQVV